MAKSQELANALLLPGTTISDMISPVGPPNDLPIVPLTMNVAEELTAPASGRGVFIFYMATPNQKVGEFWIVNALGELELASYIKLPVVLPENFTYARVIKNTFSLYQNQVIASNAGASASVQGILGGTVVQGGISQLYQSTISAANTFTLGNLSQLTGNPAYTLIPVQGYEGMGFNLPYDNREFIRIDDGIPGGIEAARNYLSQNLDYADFNVASLVWEISDNLPTNWSPILGDTLEFESPAFSVDMPYHAYIDYDFQLLSYGGTFDTNRPSFQIAVDLEFYDIARNAVVWVEKLSDSISFFGSNTNQGSSFTVPTLKTLEIHPTITAVKVKIYLICVLVGTNPYSAGSMLTKINFKTPLYRGVGFTQKPILVPFEGFSEGAPLMLRMTTCVEVQPDTQQSRITQAKQRRWNPTLAEILEYTHHIYCQAGGKYFFKPNIISGPDSVTAYVSSIKQILEYLFTQEHKVDPLNPDFSFNLSKVLKNLAPKALKAGKFIYNNGGRQIAQSALREVPATAPLAKMLPAKFASGATFCMHSEEEATESPIFMMAFQKNNEAQKTNESPPVYVEKKKQQVEQKIELSESVWANPRVFIPGIYPRAADVSGDRGLFVLMQADNSLIKYFTAADLPVPSRVGNHLIYGHTGENFSHIIIKNDLMLFEVLDIERRIVQVKSAGTGRSIGLAVALFPNFKCPLNLAITGDCILNNGGKISPMSAIVISKKLDCLPSDMRLLTGPCAINDPRVLSYDRMSDLVRDLKFLSELINSNKMNAHFTGNKRKEKPANETKVKEVQQPQSKNKTVKDMSKEQQPQENQQKKLKNEKRKQFRLKLFATDLPEQEFLELTRQQLLKKFLPVGHYSLGTYPLIGNIFFQHYLKPYCMILRAQKVLSVIKTITVILRSLLVLDVISHQGPEEKLEELTNEEKVAAMIAFNAIWPFVLTTFSFRKKQIKAALNGATLDAENGTLGGIGLGYYLEYSEEVAPEVGPEEDN